MSVPWNVHGGGTVRLVNPPACQGAHTWRLQGAQLEVPALAWWACTHCPATAAGTPATTAPDSLSWPDPLA